MEFDVVLVGFFSPAFIINVSGMRRTFRWVSLDDAFKCGGSDTQDMRERKTTTGTRRGAVVLNLQSLFQFAVCLFFLERIRRGGLSRGWRWMSAETSTSVWEAEALSDTLVLLIIESVCRRDEMQSSQCLSDAARADKSAVRGNAWRFASTREKLFAVIVSGLALGK